MAMTMIATPPLTDVATKATASGGAPKLRHTATATATATAICHGLLNPTKKHTGSTKFLIDITNHSSVSSLQRPFTVQASNNPQSQGQDSSTHEDVNYLWEVGAGSFVGAAVIKYGSILFPEITRPNLAGSYYVIYSMYCSSLAFDQAESCTMMKLKA